MKLLQCNKKHFYDGEKFASCPYCTETTRAHAYMRENINATNLNSIAYNSREKYTATEIINEDEPYEKTEIIDGESDSYVSRNHTDAN